MRSWISVAIWCLVCLAACSEPPPPKNLVLISLDTTRQDHLSLYGYERETTPNLKSLGERSVVFENAVAQMMVTNPSHASMLTGLYPHTHLVGENTQKLSDEFVTLTEVLQGHGLRTGAFVSGAPLREEITGIDQGFETYDSEMREQRFGGETTAAALEWLAGLGEAEPFFLFLHLYDAHGPYVVDDEYLDLFRSEDRGPQLTNVPKYQQLKGPDGSRMYRKNDYVDRYDALIRLQDDLVGEILGAVDLDDTLVVLVADHGETFDERSSWMTLNHGQSVYREQAAIPFLMYIPRGEPSRPVEPVETVDIMPTVLEVMGLEPPEGTTFQGESLVPLIDGIAPSGEQKLAFASSRNRFPVHGDVDVRRQGWIHSVRSRRWKLISYPAVEGEHLELYDLQQDPMETDNVVAEHPRIRDGLLRALEAWQLDDPAPETDTELSPELMKELEALGYVGN